MQYRSLSTQASPAQRVHRVQSTSNLTALSTQTRIHRVVLSPPAHSRPTQALLSPILHRPALNIRRDLLPDPVLPGPEAGLLCPPLCLNAQRVHSTECCRTAGSVRIPGTCLAITSITSHAAGSARSIPACRRMLPCVHSHAGARVLRALGRRNT